MKTKNKSFLKYAIHLKKAGVENWYFCLAIYDPEVAFIDVYKEDKEGNSTLTQQEVLRIETNVIEICGIISGKCIKHLFRKHFFTDIVHISMELGFSSKFQIVAHGNICLITD